MKTTEQKIYIQTMISCEVKENNGVINMLVIQCSECG